MVECGGLENRCGRKSTVSSNLTPSAFCWGFRAFRDRVSSPACSRTADVQPTGRDRAGRTGTKPFVTCSPSPPGTARRTADTAGGNSRPSSHLPRGSDRALRPSAGADATAADCSRRGPFGPALPRLQLDVSGRLSTLVVLQFLRDLPFAREGQARILPASSSTRERMRSSSASARTSSSAVNVRFDELAAFATLLASGDRSRPRSQGN